MAAAWDMSDTMLQFIWSNFRTLIQEELGWHVHLYQNDYTPVPGSVESDYEESDWPGYDSVTLDMILWGSITNEDHVVTTTNTAPCEFEADPSGFVSQPVYGYYVARNDGVYLYGERFATTKTMEPGGQLQVIAKLRLKTAPAS